MDRRSLRAPSVGGGGLQGGGGVCGGDGGWASPVFEAARLSRSGFAQPVRERQSTWMIHDFVVFFQKCFLQLVVIVSVFFLPRHFVVTGCLMSEMKTD